MAKSKSRSRKGSKKGSCGPGKIRRVSYRRKSYTRTTGKRVKGSKVSSSCVKDMGKPGKTRKSARVLPKFSGKLHLSNYGYSIALPEEKRHKALRDATRNNNSLEVLRHLNLARNYQSVPENKAIMARDVEYMSRLHSRTKRVSSKKGSKGSKRRSRRRVSRSKSRKGSKGSKRRSRRRVSRSKSRKGSKRSRKGSKRRSRK